RDAAGQLDVVRHRVPRELLAGHRDRRADQSAARFLDRRERLGQQILQHIGQRRLQRLLGIAQLDAEVLALVHALRAALALAQLVDLRLELCSALADDAAELLGLRAELFLTQGREVLGDRVDLIDERRQLERIALVTVAAHLRKQGLYHETVSVP